MLRYAFYFVYIIVLLLVVYISSMGMILSSLAGSGGILLSAGLLIGSLVFYVGSYKYVFDVCNNCNE